MKQMCILSQCYIKIKRVLHYWGLKIEAHGTTERNLYEWIRNPSAFMEKDSYARSLKEKFGSLMTAFPDLSDEEIDAIAAYIIVKQLLIPGMPSLFISPPASPPTFYKIHFAAINCSCVPLSTIFPFCNTMISSA